MKKSTLLALVITFIAASTQSTNAQYDYTEDLYYGHPFTYEMGASVGLMNCFTDLGGKEGFGKNILKISMLAIHNLPAAYISAPIIIMLSV